MSQQYTFAELEALPNGTKVRCVYYRDYAKNPRFDEILTIKRDPAGDWTFHDLKNGFLFCDMSYRDYQNPKEPAEEHCKGVFQVFKI